jgi:subtilisin family serine protease
LAIAAVVIAGVVSAYTASIWPQSNTGDTSVVTTKSISESQGIGGVAESQPSRTSTKSGTKSPASVPPEVTARSESEPIDVVAPKQAAIKRQTSVEYLYRALRASNDPLPQQSWVMNATKMQTAWDRSVGNGVVVAVIDTGFALAHEDLVGQWYQNPNETGMTTTGGRCWTGTSLNKATNNCDDDGNGYVDDWRGWDFANIDNSPQAGAANPNGSGVAHGTEVAGLVGATGNNGIGTATISWNNKIMPLQALSDDGSGYTSSVASAVYYAVDNGAAVINMSLGGTTNDPYLAGAIAYAHNHGVVVVAAAGNCGTGTEQGCDTAKPGAMGYPALNPYVIAVGATTSSNIRASFSSYGPALDVSAPGSGTLISPMWHSSNQTSAYATSLYGTSFASPIVASYVGLIKSLRPSSTVDDITALVDATSSKPAAMSSAPYLTQYGHGIIDADSGLRVAASLNQTSGTPELLQTGSAISEHSFKPSDTLSSGCKATSGNYCTIWAQNTAGYDRYLPYVQADINGQAGWSWPGSWLADGDWAISSRSGNAVSIGPYQLLNK